MDPGRETWHCIVIPRLDRELKDRSSAVVSYVGGIPLASKGSEAVFRPSKPASIQSRRRGRAREEEHEHEETSSGITTRNRFQGRALKFEKRT